MAAGGYGRKVGARPQDGHGRQGRGILSFPSPRFPLPNRSQKPENPRFSSVLWPLHVQGQNVTVEYHWLDGQLNRVPALLDDLIRRRVAVIATPGATSITIAAKAATATIPIVFGVSEDPVRLGLVASLARPGGNATGFNSFSREVDAKRMALLHELVPKALRVAVLLNPSTPTTETTLQQVQEAARAIGLQLQVLYANTSREIDAAFATFNRERPDALFVSGNPFISRRVQLAVLAGRERIPTAYDDRVSVAAGGLMSYGTNMADSFHHVGVYTGQILKGAKPADLPVVQAAKFEFVINLQTARTIGLDVPPQLLAIADEVIE
jgi:putative ABC transport system substrate-binding protein